MFFKEGGQTGWLTQPIRQTDPKDSAQLGAFLLRESLQEEQQLKGEEDRVRREDDGINITDSWFPTGSLYRIIISAVGRAQRHFITGKLANTTMNTIHKQTAKCGCNDEVTSIIVPETLHVGFRALPS